MNKVNSMLNARLKKGDHSSKMAAMARQSVDGQLSSFAGVFSINELNEREKDQIAEILKAYAAEAHSIDQDLSQLLAITAEVKAINNQAALLHGERIKKAHTLLTNYREGAFTAWLMTAYGNRQTPYNLMLYYEFCQAMPKTLRLQIEAMPRQAIYTLASRTGPLEKKRLIVENYQGESKAELLHQIREAFPLEDRDGRRQNLGEATLKVLQRLHRDLNRQTRGFSRAQAEACLSLLHEIQQLISKRAS